MRGGRHAGRVSFLAAALVAALTLAACGTTTVSATAKPKKSKTSTASASRYLGWSPCCSWGTTWSYDMFSPYALGILNNLVYLPLAAQDVPSLSKHTPLLARSWSVSGQKITVHLRKGVTWQNGKPVTSRDVYDTWLLYGTEGAYGWADLANISAPNPDTVVFTVASGIPTILAEDDILGGYVYPSSVYGKFVTPSLKADAVAYNNAERANPATATKIPQYTAITKAFTKLSAAKVKLGQISGDGPYVLKAITTSEAKLVKWNGYYKARNVHVPGIDYYDPETAATYYPPLLDGEADFSNVYMPPNIIKEFEGVGGHIATPLAWVFNIRFNDAHYPLNITKVRQALAYAIPRKTITEAAYGTVPKAGGKWVSTLSGIAPWLANLYLSKSQLSQLNPYATNDTKATELLESAGFHKSGSQWIMPNGKPFTLNFTVNSATTDILATFTSAEKALDSFGIKTTVDATEGATMSADQDNGDFVVGETSCGGYNPLAAYACILGDGSNYINLGTYAGKKGLGFGPTVTVPGLGTVNVHEINNEANTVAPGAKMKQLTWDWARMVNQQVPYLSYAVKVYQFPYSTKHFTDFPAQNAQGTSPLWNIMANNMELGLLVFLNDGYIRPKK